jgi:hypothetical protein
LKTLSSSVRSASGKRQRPDDSICFILHSAQFSYPLARFQTFKPNTPIESAVTSAAFEVVQMKKEGRDETDRAPRLN